MTSRPDATTPPTEGEYEYPPAAGILSMEHSIEVMHDFDSQTITVSDGIKEPVFLRPDVALRLADALVEAVELLQKEEGTRVYNP